MPEDSDSVARCVHTISIPLCASIPMFGGCVVSPDLSSGRNPYHVGIQLSVLCRFLSDESFEIGTVEIGVGRKLKRCETPGSSCCCLKH